MKTYFKIPLLLLITLFVLQGCQDNDDVAAPATLEIQDFVWKGMNQYYLWTDEVANLDETRFADQASLNNFLKDFDSPENLFAALRVDANKDKFSWIVDDYLELEGQFQGTTNNNGVEFGLSRKSTGSSEIFGFVRYIIPGSNAATKDIKRGDVFTAVNGTPLTVSNYQSLLFGANNDYTLNMADISGGAFVTNGKNIALTKTVLTENPILVNKVIISGTHKIGYLMYNAFTANFDTKLNEAFGTLKAQGITELVLDLRYNGGGSVQTATRLASMITGQFTGKVFAKQQWNKEINDYFEAENPDALYNYFTDKIGSAAINSLNLTKVYILTSASSASASELVINGLEPHINVIQIGDVTVGKNVGSVTLYDSPGFGSDNRNPKHRYAMQPIVLKIVNSVGFGDYQNGLQPDFLQKETISTMGVLGDENEPLLKTAIAKITGTGRVSTQKQRADYEEFSSSQAVNGLNQMYIEKAPEGLLKALE
ncbi:S41 family peptidase [Flavobacterium tiangeerense]|uniref:S41 family peptidase n=1 Tax=Flavobacterium tiangeerense TaxID=459471 RepID=UPI0011A3611D|nr:S41 family peptidase [Flavobacterium tiangeerense]